MCDTIFLARIRHDGYYRDILKGRTMKRLFVLFVLLVAGCGEPMTPEERLELRQTIAEERIKDLEAAQRRLERKESFERRWGRRY